MKLWTEYFGDQPIIDCSSISISYAQTGVAQLSMKVYWRDSSPPFTYQNTPSFSLCVGEKRRFKGFVMSQAVNPSPEFKGIKEWNVSAQGIVCEDISCGVQVC